MFQWREEDRGNVVVVAREKKKAVTYDTPGSCDAKTRSPRNTTGEQPPDAAASASVAYIITGIHIYAWNTRETRR